MQSRHNKQLVPLAKQLRKEMTKEERRLWYDYLRSYSVRFLRQKIIGKYIVDFYCAEAKLIIELDGSQHYKDGNIEKDAWRTEFLEGYGLKSFVSPITKSIRISVESVSLLMLRSNNPSVSFADSSLYTREPLILRHQNLRKILPAWYSQVGFTVLRLFRYILQRTFSLSDSPLVSS